ncbi:MAG: hypothetical protein GU359_05085 [Desulfurococcales archaeon]|jgi:phage/plasmid-associated DNA primase|nr:hypothetical protein [Desulfurococcales archaeon]
MKETETRGQPNINLEKWINKSESSEETSDIVAFEELDEKDIMNLLEVMKKIYDIEHLYIQWRKIVSQGVSERKSPRSFIEILIRLISVADEKMIEILEEEYTKAGIDLKPFRRDLDLLRMFIKSDVYKNLIKRLLKVWEIKRLYEKTTIVSSVFADIVIQYFQYIKNLMFNNKDLGLHCWDDKRYVECDEDVKSLIESLYRLFFIEKIGIRYSILVREIMTILEDRLREPMSEDPLSIAFDNCVFSWETLSCEPHNPNKIIFHYIPHKINKDLLNKLLKTENITEDLVNKYAPKTLKAFKEWVGDKWIILFEVIGFTLYLRPYKKMIILVDREGRFGNTGKSSFLNYLEMILGEENYSSIPLQAFEDPTANRFQVSAIYRKLANIYADLPEKALSELGGIKAATGEDTIPIEKKYKDSFKWKPYTKHIYSANELPRLVKIDMAYLDRVLIIEFLGLFEKRIHNYINTLRDEIPNAVAVGIAAFHKVLKRGSFSYENTSEDARHIWLSKTDSVYAFMRWLETGGALIKDPSGRIKIDKLYEYYSRYCDIFDRDPVAQNVFTMRLKQYRYEIKRPHNVSTLYGFRLDEKRLEEMLREEESEKT